MSNNPEADKQIAFIRAHQAQIDTILREIALVLIKNNVPSSEQLEVASHCADLSSLQFNLGRAYEQQA